MDEESKNVTLENHDASQHSSEGCDSICPLCSQVSNDCILEEDHTEKHVCSNGHHW